MKALKSLRDCKLVYRIEAVRISYEILSDSFASLRATLNGIDGKGCVRQTALGAYKHAWLFIDYVYRFLTVVSQVRGLKHQDPRFVAAQRALVDVQKARNCVAPQLWNPPEVSNETYPILGALAWASSDGKTSHVL